MTSFLNRTVLLLAALSINAPGASAESGPARAQLDRFSAGLQTLHAQFEQQVIGSDGALQDRSGGEVWMSRPQLFRWQYGGDFPELVVADGERVWVYDEMLEQVTVKDQASAVVDSPLTVLTDPDRLDQVFAVQEAGQDGDMALLELRALSLESEFEFILLGLRADELALMIMEDAFGLRTELRFERIERNPPMDPSLFTFEPPPGVDVIGDASVLSSDGP